MPLSLETQALVAAVGIEVDAAATDADATKAVTAELNRMLPEVEKQAKAVTALSAEAERLEGELEAANATKATLQLAADAAPKGVDPLVAESLGEVYARKKELAITAGFPAKAFDALDPLFHDNDGRLNVMALSASTTSGADGKPKPTRLALSVVDWVNKVATGAFGQGVTLGPAKAKAVLQASAEGEGDPQTHAPSDDRMKQLREKAGVPVA